MLKFSESEHNLNLQPPNTIYDLGDCTFNATHGELHKKQTGKHIHIEKKVSLVFQCLANAHGDIVTREEIFNQVWPNQIISDDSLNRCIFVLRRKFKSFDPKLKIKTHPKVGFHLIYPQRKDDALPLTNNQFSRRTSDMTPASLTNLNSKDSLIRLKVRLNTKLWSILVIVLLASFGFWFWISN
jgi:DNA-binding winged helix-turn-helix (wHTH) protein